MRTLYTFINLNLQADKQWNKIVTKNHSRFFIYLFGFRSALGGDEGASLGGLPVIELPEVLWIRCPSTTITRLVAMPAGGGNKCCRLLLA